MINSEYKNFYEKLHSDFFTEVKKCKDISKLSLDIDMLLNDIIHYYFFSSSNTYKISYNLNDVLFSLNDSKKDESRTIKRNINSCFNEENFLTLHTRNIYLSEYLYKPLKLSKTSGEYKIPTYAPKAIGYILKHWKTTPYYDKNSFGMNNQNIAKFINTFEVSKLYEQDMGLTHSTQNNHDPYQAIEIDHLIGNGLNIPLFCSLLNDISELKFLYKWMSITDNNHSYRTSPYPLLSKIIGLTSQLQLLPFVATKQYIYDNYLHPIIKIEPFSKIDAEYYDTLNKIFEFIFISSHLLFAFIKTEINIKNHSFKEGFFEFFTEYIYSPLEHSKLKKIEFDEVCQYVSDLFYNPYYYQKFSQVHKNDFNNYTLSIGTWKKFDITATSPKALIEIIKRSLNQLKNLSLGDYNPHELENLYTQLHKVYFSNHILRKVFYTGFGESSKNLFIPVNHLSKENLFSNPEHLLIASWLCEYNFFNSNFFFAQLFNSEATQSKSASEQNIVNDFWKLWRIKEPATNVSDYNSIASEILENIDIPFYKKDIHKNPLFCELLDRLQYYI